VYVGLSTSLAIPGHHVHSRERNPADKGKLILGVRDRLACRLR
jgi:hypothetical protein